MNIQQAHAMAVTVGRRLAQDTFDPQCRTMFDDVQTYLNADDDFDLLREYFGDDNATELTKHWFNTHTWLMHKRVANLNKKK